MKTALCLVVILSSVAWAQAPRAAAPMAAPAMATQSTTSPTIQALNEMLQQIQSFAQKTNEDVARLRPERWKTEAASRQQGQAGSESIRRNLNFAIPDLVQRIQAAPGSLNANFRLYRNLNALYDTLSALTESAGAFGPREQYDPLASDLAELDRLRHQAADRMDVLAGNNDAELARLRAAATATAAAKPAPTKIVVDDNQPKAKKKTKTSSSTPTK